jgi:hypothetical protein
MDYKPVWIFKCRECGGVHRADMQFFGKFTFPFPALALDCPVTKEKCHTAEDDWENLTEEEFAARFQRK